MDKKTVLRANYFPNYIFHVYSIAMINERDSSYRKKYIHTISNTEMEYLKKAIMLKNHGKCGSDNRVTIRKDKEFRVLP